MCGQRFARAKFRLFVPTLNDYNFLTNALNQMKLLMLLKLNQNYWLTKNYDDQTKNDYAIGV